MPYDGCDTRHRRLQGCLEGEGLSSSHDANADYLNTVTRGGALLFDPTGDYDFHEQQSNPCDPSLRLAKRSTKSRKSVASPPPTSGCSDAHDEMNLAPYGEATNSNSSPQRGQIILVATGSCMLLVSGALLMVLCALCVKRYRRRSAVQRTAGPTEAANGPHTERFKPSLCYVSGSSSVCSQATCRTPPCSYHDIRTATCCCDACSAAHASTPRLTTSLVGRRHTILTVPAHTISASTGDLPVKLAHGFLAPGADSMRLVHWHFSPSVLPPCETTVCRLVLAGTASFRTTHFIAHTVLQRDRSATAATRAGMQPPLWDPYPRGGLRASIASTSSCVSPKASSHRHLYVELPDSTLALAVKDPPSLGSSRNMLPQPYPGVPPPPFLLEANTLDGPPGSAGSSFPHTIHFTSYMPILLHPTLSGVQIPGTINASLQPISPLYAHPAGLHLSGSGRLQPPSDAQEPPGSTASSRPLSDTTAERPIDPDLLRRRQSLRQPYQAQEMLYSCNSDSTAETLFVRMQPPLSAAEMTAIGLPSSEGLAGMQRDSRAAIGLPSIAPPVDAAAGGALVAALSQRNVNGPAIGLPVSELRCCHSAPSSARCAVADTDDGRGGVPEEQKPASAEPGVGPEAGVAGAYIAAASAPVTAAESGRQVGAAAQHDAAQPASAAGAAASTDAPGSPQGGEAEA